MTSLRNDNTIVVTRRALVRNTVVLVTASFFALIAVQLADVSILSPLTADLILVAGALQFAVVLWCLQMRRCQLPLVGYLAAFIGLEVVLALVILAAVPWEVIAEVRQGLNIGPCRAQRA